MTVIVWIFFVGMLALLLLVAGMRPYRSMYSRFEVERRVKSGDEAAMRDAARLRSFDDIVALQRVVSALLSVVIIVICVLQLGWAIGTIVAVVILLEYPVVAKLSVISTYGQKIYDRIEPKLLQITERHSRVFVVVRAHSAIEEPPIMTSKEELQYSIAAMTEGLTSEEKRLITHGLSFGERLVSEVMTPRSMVDAVAKDEVLGPLALDELHKTGHTRFPVIDKDVDHVIGMLYIQDLLTVKAQKTLTAHSAMAKKVYYIHESQTLQHALNAFIRTHHHLFVVVNEYRETVGVLSLEDVMEALLGREIIDEYDAHDDLRKVAARNPRSNNVPSDHVNV